MINHIKDSEQIWTRKEVQDAMGVRSRTTLNIYCNHLHIPVRLRQFTQEQYEQIMELRDWVLQRRAMCDFVLNNESCKSA